MLLSWPGLDEECFEDKRVFPTTMEIEKSVSLMGWCSYVP